AEDGIRDFHVTGVQTCALPIFKVHKTFVHDGGAFAEVGSQTYACRMRDPHAFRHNVVGHLGEFIDAGNFKQLTIEASLQLTFGQLCQINRSEEQRLNSSHVKISYAVFCLKKKTYMDTSC